MLSLSKKYIFLSLCLSAYVFISAQAFNNYYQSGLKSAGLLVNYENNNQVILTSVYTDSSSTRQGLDLKLINNSGNVLVRKRFLLGDYDYIPSGGYKFQEEISNSTMLLTGVVQKNGSQATVFISVNKVTLDTNWTRYYSDANYVYSIGVVFKTKPNEVWFMGGKSNANGYADRPFAFKTDTLGNILSTKEFTNLINYSERKINYDDLNSRIYITGLNTSNPAAPETIITCLDTIGNVMWNQQIGNNPYYLFPSRIAIGTNYVILSGAKITYSDAMNGNILMKLCLTKINKSNGNVVWQKTYADNRFGSNLFGLTINPDESILTTGSYQFTGQNVGLNANGIILKTNSVGDSLWLKSFSTYSTSNMIESFVNVKSSPDGGYIICGHPSYGTNYHSWLVKTDSLGNAPGMYTAPTNTTSPTDTTIILGSKLTFGVDGSEIVIFPVPANDKLIIKSVNESAQLVYESISVYNSLGQLVKKEILSGQNANIILTTKEFDSGLYYLQLTDKAKKSIIKKIIISR